MRKDEIQREKEDGSMKATVEGWESRTKNEMVKEGKWVGGKGTKGARKK